VAQVVESQKDATAVSVQTQSGMELDISRKHAAPKSNPPKAGPLIASGRSLRMECHVWVSQISSSTTFLPFCLLRHYV
jgi:hypothetical protein